MDQFPPSPSHWGRFEIFRKFAEIFATQGAPPVSWTLVANGKIFNQKSNHYFFWTPLSNRLSIIDKVFPSLKAASCLILFPLFATGVVDTGGAP
jgi:hypothetical protein